MLQHPTVISFTRKSKQSTGLLALFFLLLCAVLCSVAVSGQQHDSHLVCRFAGSLFLLSAIGMVALAMGWRILGTSQVSLLNLALAFLCGYGLWGMLVFFTGVLHGLYRSILAAELLCLGILFRRNVNEIPGILRRLMARFAKAPPAVRVIMGAVGVYTCFLLLISLGPVEAWDALGSHWAIAKHFARHHGVPFPIFNGNGGTPQLMRVIYAVFCVFEFDHQASHGVWLLFPAMIGMVYGVVRRFSSSGVGLALTMGMFILLFLQPKFTTQPILDFPVAVFGLGAVIAALAPRLFGPEVGLAGESSRTTLSRFIVLSGVLCGYAVATKWHAMPLYLVLLACFFLLWWEVLSRAARWKMLTLCAVFALLPVIIFSIYDFIFTGNPFWHPMIPTFWNPEYWAKVPSSIFLTREHMDVVRAKMYPSPVLNPVGALSCIIYGHVLVLPGLFFVPFALFNVCGQIRRVVWLLLPAGLFTVLASSALLGTNLRHTLLGMGILLLLLPLGWDALTQHKFRWLALVVPLLALAGVAHKVSDRRLPVVEQYLSAFKSVTWGPYFDRDYQNTFGYSATRWANTSLEEDAKIVADALRLGNLDRDWMTISPVVQCIVAVSPEMSADSLRRALRRIGATHLWVDQHQLWKDPTNFPSVPLYLTPWGKLIKRDEWLEPVYADSLVCIYRMK